MTRVCMPNFAAERHTTLELLYRGHTLTRVSRLSIINNNIPAGADSLSGTLMHDKAATTLSTESSELELSDGNGPLTAKH